MIEMRIVLFVIAFFMLFGSTVPYLSTGMTVTINPCFSRNLQEFKTVWC